MGKYCKFKRDLPHPTTNEVAFKQGEMYPVLYETEEGVNKLGEPIAPAYWFGELAIEKFYEGVIYEIVVVDDAENTEVEDNDSV